MKKNRPGQGRKPKPIEQHILNGNPSRLNLPDPVPVPKDRPAPPEHYDEISTKYWNDFCDAVESMGVISSIDAPMMEMLCDSWRGYREMQEHIHENGYTELSKYGRTVSQCFRARKVLFQECMQLLIQFGFSPVARAQLARGADAKSKEEDPLAAILKKRAERN